MGVIVGIDIGGSTTKIAGLGCDGSLLFTQRFGAERRNEDLPALVSSCLAEHGLTAQAVQKLALTGVGASFLTEDMFRIPTCTVAEFSASAAGALALSGREQAVVCTMGTGTAFLWAEQPGTVRHLCGSGIGGATLSGLCRRLAGVDQPGEIDRLACAGDLQVVDLTIADLTTDPTLDPTLTAANFCKEAPDATPADLAAGAANLVLQAIGTMTVLSCQCCDTKTVVLLGSMTGMEAVRRNFQVFNRCYGIEYIIPQHAAFATAIGAGLCALRN